MDQLNIGMNKIYLLVAIFLTWIVFTITFSYYYSKSFSLATVKIGINPPHKRRVEKTPCVNIINNVSWRNSHCLRNTKISILGDSTAWRTSNGRFFVDNLKGAQLKCIC